MAELTEKIINKYLILSRDLKFRSLGLDSKPPFQVRNPLEYLGALETHISHILADILSYAIYDEKTNKLCYPVLESFIKRFLKNQDIEVVSPKINAEMGDIDILIKDSKYVIIVENKIKGATYQPWQPAKYVQKHKCEGKRVFVVLLPQKMSQGERSYIDNIPEWKPEEGKEKIKYGCIDDEPLQNVDCYVRAIHKDLAEWLSKDEEIKNIPLKEKSLRSTIYILVDYLNKIYGINQQSEYEMDRIELLKGVLGLNDPTGENLDSLLENKIYIDELLSDIRDLNNVINQTYNETVTKFMYDCYTEILNTSKKENERFDVDVSWPWPWPVQDTQTKVATQINIGITILINPGCINVGIKYSKIDQRVLIGIFTENKDKNLTQESVDKANRVLRNLGLHEMNIRTQNSEFKGFPFSQAKDKINALIKGLFEIKNQNNNPSIQ